MGSLKPIADYSAYSITEDGDIWTYKRNRFLKPHYIRRRGHVTTTIVLKRDDGKWMTLKIGHLVLLAHGFVRPEGAVMRHLDGNGSRNQLSNLAWGTQAENIADAMRHGTASGAVGESNSHAKLTPDLVFKIKDQVRDGLPRKQIAKSYGVHVSTINYIAQGRSWKHLEAA